VRTSAKIPAHFRFWILRLSWTGFAFSIIGVKSKAPPDVVIHLLLVMTIGIVLVAFLAASGQPKRHQPVSLYSPYPTVVKPLSIVTESLRMFSSGRYQEVGLLIEPFAVHSLDSRLPVQYS
jgi:hypothetical protein